MDLRIWSLFNLASTQTSESFLDKIRLAYVFGSAGHDALMVTEDDEVFAFGLNEHGYLGIGDDEATFIPTKVIELCGEGVKGFSFGYNSAEKFIVAYTYSGKVYAWGRQFGELVTKIVPGSCTMVPKLIDRPTLVAFPSESIEISEVACGTSHCLALSTNGEVFSWGFNDVGQLGRGTGPTTNVPGIVKGPLEYKCVIKISCGDNFSVVLLNDGEVYAWGDNNFGQIGLINNEKYSAEPVQIQGLNHVIKDLVCGSSHVLVLTNVGDVYSWGKNVCGQLGLDDQKTRFFPERIQTRKKFTDIAAVCKCSISAAMNDQSEVFMWGDFSDIYQTTPLKTVFKSLQEVFAHFATPRIMYKPLVRQLKKSSKSTFVIPDKIFQDQATSDLTLTVQGKQIFVHREILSSRSEYFRTFLQEHWVEKNQTNVCLDQRYEAVHSYLQYIYTGEVKADPELAPDLLCLASEYQDLAFKDLCEECVDFDIGMDNVANLFALALKLKATKLLEKCINFASYHISEVLLTPAVSEWDKDTLQEFVMQCQKRKLFRS